MFRTIGHFDRSGSGWNPLLFIGDARWKPYRNLRWVSMWPAFRSVVVLGAGRAAYGEISFDVRFGDHFGGAFCTDDDLDSVSGEDVDRTLAHAAADDHVHSEVMEEVGEEPGPVAGVGDRFHAGDLSVLDGEYFKGLTVSEMATDVLVLACYCNLFHC